MPRRRQKRRQGEEARPDSLGSRDVVRVHNAFALDTRNRSIREAVAEIEGETLELERQTSRYNIKDFSANDTRDLPAPQKTTPDLPSTRLICPGLKEPLAKRLTELGSFSTSNQTDVTLRKAVEAMDFLLNRIEEMESECVVDETQNCLDEFERLTALQYWLDREIADVTKRHRHLTSLVVELWKAFRDRPEDERAHAKFISQVLYPYFAERVKKVKTLNSQLAEKVESIRPNGDEVRRLRCEREDFDQELIELQDALTHMEVKPDVEKRTMEQTMDRLSSEYDRDHEKLRVENRRLVEELGRERRNAEELAAQLVEEATCSSPKRVDTKIIKRLIHSVYPTLFAKHDGYTSISDLLRDLREDAGINGEEEARKADFESFRGFLHSDHMASISCVENGPAGVPIYKAIPNESNAHIRAEQEKSAENQETQIKKLRRYLQNEKDRANALEVSLREANETKDREVERTQCTICMDRRSDTTFICVREDNTKFVCGHLACIECAEKWKNAKKECHD